MTLVQYNINVQIHVIRGASMKVKNAVWFMLVITLLFNCSCRVPPSDQVDSSDGETIEQPEPQIMAYRLGGASRVGEDIYFMEGVSFAQAPIYATEYGSENFDVYVPCFDTVCNHSDRTKCCVAISGLGGGIDQFAAFLYNGEPAMVLYNAVDIWFSRPYSNEKVNLLCEDFVKMEQTNAADAYFAYFEWVSAGLRPQRNELLVYGDYLYYVEIKNGVRTQYRMLLDGGEPERVFEENNIIIKTIINDKFYGIRYEVDSDAPEETGEDRDKIRYFRSDMNYGNIEELPEILDFFYLSGDKNFTPRSNTILYADKDFIYVLNDMKVWKVSDSDIYAEPILLSDMEGKIPYEQSADLRQTSWYNNGYIYTVLNTGLHGRSLLDEQGNAGSSTQWYENSMLYSFDIKTGECSSLDISSQSYLITEILYADDQYVYAEGRYAHDDGRGIQGVTIRLTLETMRYEVLLPERFLDYSAETTAG